MPDPRPLPLLHLDLRAPRGHLVEACLSVSPALPLLDLRLPAWTPGSYLIRDHVRGLEGLAVEQNGEAVALERLAPARWRARLHSLAPVLIRYRILATERSVRTCELDGDHGFLALAAAALLVEGERWRAHRLSLSLPGGWEPFVALPREPDGTWLARDYDQLIDTPVECGPHPCHAFAVATVPHRWVTWGGDLPREDPQWLEDVERVCLAACRLLEDPKPPGDPYLFVLHLLDQGYGGLEHDHGTVLQYGRRALGRPEGRRKLLQLVAHEYLHQWNVRRLRPAELHPLDYDRAVPVPTLWFAEGVTSYYDQFIPLMAGISSEADLLEDLGADLSRFLLTPGRRVQSLRESSQEAWVKLYRQDTHSADSQISYYLKGSVLALVLDLHLRRRGSALSVVLRQLWASHGRSGRGYGEADLLAAFTGQAPDLSTLLPHWLSSTEDPALDAYLEDVGLRLVSERCALAHVGWQLEAPAGSLQLRRVERHGPAERSGLRSGDELLALDGWRLRREEDLAPLLAPAPEAPPAGEPQGTTPSSRPLEVLFCRDGRVRTTHLVPRSPAIARWRLETDPHATPEAARRRARWLALVP